jgi:mannan endo-1,4-beta-mannosidase
MRRGRSRLPSLVVVVMLLLLFGATTSVFGGTASAFYTSFLATSSTTAGGPIATPIPSPIAGLTPTPGLAPTGFATRSGTQFLLNGQPFHFIGANRYQAATMSDSALDQMFQALSSQAGGKVLRFWAFQSYTNGGTDWSGIDRVVAHAKSNGILLIPVLENQWQDCTQGGYKYDSWYQSGYNSPYGSYPLSFRDYVARIVNRYKNEPTIFAWMLMNEAESKSSGGSSVPTALYNFTADMSSYIKSLDSNHMVTLGNMSNEGQPGTEGENFTKLYSLSTIDFAECHDYHADTLALPGSNSDGTLPTSWSSGNSSFAVNMARALKTLGKPFVVGEAGIQAGSGYSYTVDQRASLFDKKLAAHFNNGGSGYLIWAWSTESGGWDFSPGDPLNSVLYKYR